MKNVSELIQAAESEGINFTIERDKLSLDYRKCDELDRFIERHIIPRKDEIIRFLSGEHEAGKQLKRGPISITQLWQENPSMRNPVIKGLLREGETCNIIASPKMGKSWLAGGLAWSIARGIEWMGFETTQGRVLIIDNELHSQTLSARLSAISNEMQIETEYHENLDVLSLRGAACGVQELQGYGINSGRYSLIVIDALYRTLPDGTSENDNAQMMAVYNHLDRLAANIGSAIVVIHHSSKGDQTTKGITDVGSGAGAISRAADTHLVIRPHEEEGFAVLEAVTRSFKSPEPVTIEFQYPVWLTSGNPATIRTTKQALAIRQKESDAEADELVKKSMANGKRLSNSELRSKTGMGADRITRSLNRLNAVGKRCKSKRTGRVTERFSLPENTIPGGAVVWTG